MSTLDRWDPAVYGRFEEERAQPFFDLLALVQRLPGMRVVDLGCGNGARTRDLHLALGATETLGLDRSHAMISAAASVTAPGLTFREGSIADFEAEDLDLVFSNAALHWLPDHPALFARLTKCLRPGGQLAVQVPANDDYPTHRESAALAALPPFHDALGGYVQRYGTLGPVDYARLLVGLGYERPHVRLQVYVHLLPSREHVVDWVRGSHLTDYEARLPKPLFEQFLRFYRDRLFRVLEDERPFVYPFKRILIHAVKAR